MSYTKITSDDTQNKGVVGLPDTPGLSTTEMQEKFDELVNDVVIPKFNNLVDELDASDIEKRIHSDDITDVRLNADNNIEVSTDNGRTYKQTASSGHIIMDGTGRSFPQRSRMQYSANAIITDNQADNTTFIQIPSGTKGDKGDSATIQIGNVQTSQIPYVTNVGSQYDAIFDFGIPNGADGQNATIQVGTVTSGANASVSNRGTSTNAILDFVLPKGDKGDSGTSFQVLGMYATYQDLILAHPVGNRGDAYAVGNSTTNEVYNWNNDTQTWDNLGALKGVKGDDGQAATITVGTVTTGQTSSVINSGTTENAILNFVLEKGDKGDTGASATIAVGTVTKGENPSVLNVGTLTNAIFDFVIPKGDKGDTGAPSIVNGKSGESIVLYGYDMFLKNYVKSNAYAPITDDDSIQSAIGKLDAKGGGGSKIEVDTDDESIGNTFTVSNGAKTYTQIADSSMKMVFFVDDIGEWTITNVEAQNSTKINITYFSAFHVVLGVGNINVIITYSEDYIGETFTITGDGVSKTKTATSDMTVSFVLAKTGTYTISNSLNDITKNVNATEETTYDVSFVTSSYDFNGWLASANITKSFSSLDDVLSDETVVRELMTKHASADFLVAWYENDNAIVDTFVASVNAMKWIGHRDYICDKLLAIPTWKSAMLESENWEYILKDKVPTMTSNNAPYGVASANSTNTGFEVYNAFDGVESTRWVGAGNVSSWWIGYKFTNPICVKKFMFISDNDASGNGYKLQGSNSGADGDYHDIHTFDIVGGKNEIEVINDDYYLYYRITVPRISIYSLQFYGRSLNVSVPTMTSNTEPWGKVIRSSAYSNDYEAWKAFDGVASGTDRWATPSSNVEEWIGYDFGKLVNLKYFYIREGDAQYTKSYEIQGRKKDGTWERIESYEDGAEYKIKNVNTSKSYSAFRFYCKTYTTGSPTVLLMNFYGVDYSEREFAEGSTMKYLYDNGLELEPISVIAGTSCSAQKDTSTVKLSTVGAGYGANTVASMFSNAIDINVTPYNYNRIRCKYTDYIVGESSSVLAIGSGGFDVVPYTENGWVGKKMFAQSGASEDYLGISSISGNYKVSVLLAYNPNQILKVNELWLE